MNLKDLENYIIDYIKNNYTLQPDITTEFLDLDRFKNPFTLFLDISKIDFTQKNYNDDCEDSGNISITIYFVMRNKPADVLNTELLEAVYLFYKLIKRNPNLNNTDIFNTIISSIDLFKYVEGSKYLVCAEFTINMECEL
jgi:hypothetical protein